MFFSTRKRFRVAFQLPISTVTVMPRQTLTFNFEWRSGFIASIFLSCRTLHYFVDSFIKLSYHVTLPDLILSRVIVHDWTAILLCAYFTLFFFGYFIISASELLPLLSLSCVAKGHNQSMSRHYSYVLVLDSRLLFFWGSLLKMCNLPMNCF